MPQKFVSVPGFTCLEYVSHLAWLNGQGRRQAKTEASRWLAAVGLDGYERHSCQKLSGGQQSRLALAMALNSGAELVLLDEPGAALDPLSKEMLRELYGMVVSAGMNLVVSSHDPTDILGPFARVVIIDRGAVRFIIRRKPCGVMRMRIRWWRRSRGRCFPSGYRIHQIRQ